MWKTMKSSRRRMRRRSRRRRRKTTSRRKRRRTGIAYGVATISRLLRSVRFFCKRALYKRLYSAKETYDFTGPNSRSHPIVESLSRGTVTITEEKSK